MQHQNRSNAYVWLCDMSTVLTPNCWESCSHLEVSENPHPCLLLLGHRQHDGRHCKHPCIMHRHDRSHMVLYTTWTLYTELGSGRPNVQQTGQQSVRRQKKKRKNEQTSRKLWVLSRSLTCEMPNDANLSHFCQRLQRCRIGDGIHDQQPQV